MSVSAGTLYRRSLRRLERRRLARVAARQAMLPQAHLFVACMLHEQAIRTTNRLAYAAGIAGPLAQRS